jgi:hypothetical protein
MKSGGTIDFKRVDMYPGAQYLSWAIKEAGAIEQ